MSMCPFALINHLLFYVDETSSSHNDHSDDGSVGLDAYIPTERLKKLREQKVVPGVSRGRPSKVRKRTQYAIGDAVSSKPDKDDDVDDVFVVLDDEDGALGSLPSREEGHRGSRHRHGDDETRMLLQSCLQDDDYLDDGDDDNGGAVSDEGDELDVFRLTQKVPVPELPATDSGEASGDGQEDMIELRFVDQHRHEFVIRAFTESSFRYPCAKFVEHANAEGWISQGEENIAKYVFDGDKVDIDAQTPSELGMEDGDTVDVYYNT
jgi:hypothetical protein